MKINEQLSKLTMVALLAFSPTAFALDFDGDGKNDLAVFRPRDSEASNNGVFRFESTSRSAGFAYEWGRQKDIPVPGKFFNTAGADLAFFRRSNGGWFIRKFDSALGFNNTAGYRWGKNGDNPNPCDVNGDGLTDMVIFRPSNGTWYSLLSSTTADQNFTGGVGQKWGASGDLPIAYDFDGDGKCDYTVYRKGTWNILLSSTNNTTPASILFGGKSDIPVPGQYTSDTLVDLAVYRPRSQRRGGSLWIIRSSNTAGLTTLVYRWGNSSDIPTPADWDGDGKTDIAFFRPSEGVWYVRTSSSNYANAETFQFGARRDNPIGDRRGFDPN